MPSQRILFAIRAKLGDSLIPYGMVRAYADAHPRDEVWLLIRRDYGGLLGNEAGVRFVPFGSRLEMIARLLWIRLTQPQFDVLATLWAFGKPALRIAQVVRARRKIYLNDRFSRWYPEWPSQQSYGNHIDGAWLVTRVFAPDIAKPARLEIPSLSAMRNRAPKPGAVGVVPAADEDRRTFDVATLMNLLREVSARHPRPQDLAHRQPARSRRPCLHGDAAREKCRDQAVFHTF